MGIPLQEKAVTKKALEQRVKKLFWLLYDFSWDMGQKPSPRQQLRKVNFIIPVGAITCIKISSNVHLCKNN